MNDEQRFTFTKDERVTGERRIEALFARGYSFMAYPFRVVYLKKDLSLSKSVSILISVPKKRIRSSVQRNRLKRLTREAYRLNKHLLTPFIKSEHAGLDMAFIYVKDDIADYAMVEKGMIKALRVLVSELDSGRVKC